MKFNFILAVLCTASFSLAHAGADVRMIAKGDQFKCVPFPKNPAADAKGGMVTCTVIQDVYSHNTKKPVVPHGSKLVGEIKSGQLVWASWTTPTGINVRADAAGTKPYLVSDLAASSDQGLPMTVTATHDIRVELSANLKL